MAQVYRAGPCEGQACRHPLLSIVTPAYNEAENLPLLYERLAQVLDSSGLDWEWIIVDDHSADRTFAVIEAIVGNDPRIRGLRLRGILARTRRSPAACIMPAATAPRSWRPTSRTRPKPYPPSSPAGATATKSSGQSAPAARVRRLAHSVSPNFTTG